MRQNWTTALVISLPALVCMHTHTLVLTHTSVAMPGGKARLLVVCVA
jgi:hypothetical protein